MRGGLTAIDVLVVLLLVGILVLVLLMTMPRGREQARLAACQRNLGQIGLALAQYDQAQGRLPTVGMPAAIDPPARETSPGPLRILLETLGQADFLGLAPNVQPKSTGPVPGEVPVPGFVCSSDSNATARLFRAPISYRAATGDSSRGKNGVFAPGRRISLAEVEEGDGTSFTAAFSERLVGDNDNGHIAPNNYAVAIEPLPLQFCTLIWLKDQSARWYGDAGSAWAEADYRSTLYNHGPLPGARLSCVAADGGTALMGASSGHVRGVNLLLLDGSVKLVLPTVARPVWSELAACRGRGEGRE